MNRSLRSLFIVLLMLSCQPAVDAQSTTPTNILCSTVIGSTFGAIYVMIPITSIKIFPEDLPWPLLNCTVAMVTLKWYIQSLPSLNFFLYQNINGYNPSYNSCFAFAASFLLMFNNCEISNLTIRLIASLMASISIAPLSTFMETHDYPQLKYPLLSKKEEKNYIITSRQYAAPAA